MINYLLNNIQLLVWTHLKKTVFKKLEHQGGGQSPN